MRKKFVLKVFAIMLTALTATASAGVAGEAASRLWSIAVHLDYADGSAYDYVIATGVSTGDMPSFLAECGRSHRTGTVVRYHCYPIAE